MRTGSGVSILSAGAALVALPLLLGVGQGAPIPENLAQKARPSASSSATPDDGKYGALRLNDGDADTHWASANNTLPQWVRLDWDEVQEVDTLSVSLFATPSMELYASWKRFEVELSDGTKIARDVEADKQGTHLLRLEAPHRITWLKLTILSVYEPKHYVGVSEVGVYRDPDKRIREKRPQPVPLPREAIPVLGGRPHPTVYVTAEDVARARRNAEQTEWGRLTKEQILQNAARWLERTEEEWLRFLPEPGACYAYGFTGCPICGAGWGQWGNARCSWEEPGKVKCANGHVLPDAEHPDDGSGYQGPDGRIHYFVGSWNAWVTEQWQHGAITNLAHAYALTGDERYADRAAFFLDALASIYAESTSGSWDYPSSPPSGRFARPWYQVARNLVPFVEAYDLIYNSPALQKPSLRPRLEKNFPQGPTLQQRVVKTPDAHGKSWEGMTRRENIDVNLMQDGAYYCYAHTFSGALHNGHADYMRGALAVGALLNIPTYVHNAIESPYSIYAMIANNCDRDGRYYETALGYALHCRDLYLTFTEPLRNWRDEKYPQGVDLFQDARFRTFFLLPDLTMDVAGHALNFGDCAPDPRYVPASDEKFSLTDYNFAERLYAGCTGKEREYFGRLLAYLAGGDVERARASAPSIRRWLLYHADPVPVLEKPTLPPDLQRKVFGSWFLGQKGLAILRDGSGPNAQGALVRYGPTLNHGHLDDLNLAYYAKGWQCTYEIGYGLGSTHTQVGWARQTASHTLVVVNESPQRGGPGGGSGGSLYLFARLPGIKILEADSPLSYAAEGVSQYRRTVALIGEGRDQYLVDFFRVAGGHQHDYLVGSQDQQFTVGGITLGPEEEGSLAGLEHAWGEKLGVDGDVKGFPNRPYWNPPPGNGYGFFYDMRRAPTAGPWWVDWLLGGPNEAHFRVHVLPEGPAEAIVAKAPGLYPHIRKASYLILRRKGENLRSRFASVMEPYANVLPRGLVGFTELLRRRADSRGELVSMPNYEALLLRGQQIGDFAAFTLSVPEAGEYDVVGRFLRSPSYGVARVLVDGQPVGEPWSGVGNAVEGPFTVTFGRVRLQKGDHRVAVEMTQGAERYLIGIASLGLVPAGLMEAAAAPKPILTAVERLSVAGDDVAEVPIAVRVRRGNREEVFASQVPLTGQPGERVPSNSVPIGSSQLVWSGGVVYVAMQGNEAVEAALHGGERLRAGGLQIQAQTAAHFGRVVALDYEKNTVDVDCRLPTVGLEGEGVYFSNPRYSRNTAYRIERIEALPNGSRIHLGSQTMVLGQGRVADVLDEHTLTTEIPHDYARSVVGGTNDAFFNGKRIVAEDGTFTHLREVNYGNPMRLVVDDASRFEPGHVFRYLDVQEGDAFTIPTAIWLSRTPQGTWRLVSSTSVRWPGARRYRLKGGDWRRVEAEVIPPTGMDTEAEVEVSRPGT